MEEPRQFRLDSRSCNRIWGAAIGDRNLVRVRKNCMLRASAQKGKLRT